MGELLVCVAGERQNDVRRAIAGRYDGQVMQVAAGRRTFESPSRAFETAYMRALMEWNRRMVELEDAAGVEILVDDEAFATPLTLDKLDARQGHTVALVRSLEVLAGDRCIGTWEPESELPVLEDTLAFVSCYARPGEQPVTYGPRIREKLAKYDPALVRPTLRGVVAGEALGAGIAAEFAAACGDMGLTAVHWIDAGRNDELEAWLGVYRELAPLRQAERQGDVTRDLPAAGRATEHKETRMQVKLAERVRVAIELLRETVEHEDAAGGLGDAGVDINQAGQLLTRAYDRLATRAVAEPEQEQADEADDDAG